MVVGNWPASGKVEIGQRWIREDSLTMGVVIIEITKTNGKDINGFIVQNINDGLRRNYGNLNANWCSNVNQSECKYTYLEGQDAPIKLATE